MDDGERGNCGFSEIQRIDRENSLGGPSSSDSSGLTSTKRVHPIAYVLITNRLTSYKDLKYNLTVDDMLDLYEICMVNLHNKSTLVENKGNK